MEFDRRTMLAGTAAAIATGPALAKGRASAGSWYDRAVIIDALGGLSDPYAPNDQLRLSDRVWTEMLATGVNVLRDTVMPVGNGPDPWGDFQKDLQGAIFGGYSPRVAIPELLGLYQEGRLKLDELVTNRYSLDQINEGYQAMRDGTNIRGVIVYE